MSRSIVKTAVAAALCWSGANRMISALPRLKTLPLVLAYHSVVEDVRPYIGRVMLPNLISVDMLERQLDWIGRRYRFVTLDEIGRQIEAGDDFARPTAAVTFDDGYVDVYHHALPLLKRKGIPAGVFLVTETIGRPGLQLYDKLYLLLNRTLPLLGHSRQRLSMLLGTKTISLNSLNERMLHDPFQTMRWLFTSFPQRKLRRVIAALETIAVIEDSAYPELQCLTWEMVGTMVQTNWTIGSHTQTHAVLTRENPQRVANQTLGSMKTLKEKLGQPIAHFAYPDGQFNPDVVSSVAKAGYRYGYGTCLHRDHRYLPLTIPRKLMWERTAIDGKGRFSENVMSCHASRLFDLWAQCRHNHGTPISVVDADEQREDFSARCVRDSLHA